MQLQAILNRVEKQKGFAYRNARFANDRSEILVDIHPHGRSRPVCSKCGRKGPQYDTLGQRRFEFVPLWAIAVFFRYSMRRVDCPERISQQLRRLCTTGDDLRATVSRSRNWVLYDAVLKHFGS